MEDNTYRSIDTTKSGASHDSYAAESGESALQRESFDRSSSSEHMNSNDMPYSPESRSYIARPEAFNSPETPESAEHSEASDVAIEKKEYQHWETEAEKEQNRDAVIAYDFKKNSVDKATLTTQRDILINYGNYFDKESGERIKSELGSNKVEIYNSPYFTSHFSKDYGKYYVTGFRTVEDGKICLRDTDNVDNLTHTATHEAVHDMSFQRGCETSSARKDSSGRDILSTKKELSSGIERIESVKTTTPSGLEKQTDIRRNRYLNEGFTELYTIDSLERRGQVPDFTSYTEEVGWAGEIRDCLGDDVTAKAFFGGDISTLENRFNALSDIPNAWRVLNDNIDAYHTSTIEAQRKIHRKIIENVMLSLREPKGFGGRRAH